MKNEHSRSCPAATDKFVEAIKSLGEDVEEPDMLISKLVNVLELA